MRSRVLNTRLRERVVVTTKTGQAFAGILYSADDKAIVLKQASAIGVAEDKSDVDLDGEWIVLTSNVDWIQRP